MDSKVESTDEKPIGYHDKPMSFWQRLPHRSDTGGVSPFFLEGRERYMNERMRGMNSERRAWRKQWLLDQHLSPREPVEVPELYTYNNNIFRRVWNWPFRKLESYLKPKMGHPAVWVRLSIQHVLYTTMALYAITYITMYHSNNWEFFYGLRIISNKPVIFPGDEHYPFTSKMKMDDYASYKFKDSVLYKSEEQIRAEEAKKIK